jgi:hypothetical protein
VAEKADELASSHFLPRGSGRSIVQAQMRPVKGTRRGDRLRVRSRHFIPAALVRRKLAGGAHIIN